MGMNKKGKCLLDFIDFPFTICNAKESNNGEDSFLLHLLYGGVDCDCRAYAVVD